MNKDIQESSATDVGQELSFVKELRALINKHCKENESNTPDFILARYLSDCLMAFNRAQQERSDWNGLSHEEYPLLGARHNAMLSCETKERP